MSISLNGSLRTCKVSTGWANRIQSDRFENPNLMVCPVWNGRDLAGRPACASSFYTKSPGCNSSSDRVLVENNLRPQYMEYIQLNAAGISAPIYGSTNMHSSDALVQTRSDDELDKVTGSFGMVSTGLGHERQSTCPIYAYDQAMAQQSENGRMIQAMQTGVQSNNYREAGGDGGMGGCQGGCGCNSKQNMGYQNMMNQGMA